MKVNICKIGYTLECQQGDEICFRNNKIREFDTLERQTIGVNKYESTFPMASCNKKRCNHRKKTWRKKIWKYAIVFASTQLRITRLLKYPIDPKAYLGRWRLSSYRVDTILWRTDPLTEARGKIYMQELWFLCMAHLLNVLYKCMKFCWNTSNCYQVIERTQNIIANYLREINSKKYPKQSYDSCAWHVIWMCFTNVWSFVEIPLTVFKL